MADGTASATLRGNDNLPLREKIVYFAYVDAAGSVLAGRTVITNYLGVAELPLTERPPGATQIRAYFGVAETPVPGGEVIDLSDPSYAAAGPVSAALPSTAPVARPDSYTTVEGRTLAVAAPGCARQRHRSADRQPGLRSGPGHAAPCNWTGRSPTRRRAASSAR